MNKLVTLDHQITIFLNQLGSEQMDAFWLWITEASSWYWMYGACILLFFILDRAWGFVALAATLITFGLSDWISVHAFKDVFERLRPCHQEGVMEYIRLVPEGCGGSFGFVSSHAANTFGLAVFLVVISSLMSVGRPIFSGFTAFSMPQVACTSGCIILAMYLEGLS